jgi:hypothetical protein
MNRKLLRAVRGEETLSPAELGLIDVKIALAGPMSRSQLDNYAKD